MGTSRNSRDLVRKMNAAADALVSNRPGIEAAALAGKQIFLAELAAAGVDGTTRISKSVKARYDVKGRERAVALLRYTGQAHLLNNPTKPHRIEPRGKRGRRRGKKALTIGDDVRASANHPGTPGLRFFEKARPVVAKLAPKVYQRVGMTEPLRRVFR